MEVVVKVLISSKANLKTKYGNALSEVEKLFAAMVKADKKRSIKTHIVYIDDAKSTAKIGITAVTSVTRQSAKKSVDEIYAKLQPAYILLFGAQDIFPFQEINNPANDDDKIVPSDLPYACDTPYSMDIKSFTGPTRVVGRIPDIPGNADIAYLKTVVDTIVKYKCVTPADLTSYFAVTADVWKKSTQQSLNNMFGNSANLKNSPMAVAPHTTLDLKPLVHFYNCHGSPTDSKYYGQKGNNYPTAQCSIDLNGKISTGTIVAAECCYGAETFDPNNEGFRNLSMANTYFKNKAIAFVGSSTIAYGPSSGNSLADLLTQYFIKNVIAGASFGRAFLEARQKFLTLNGPFLDAYELKTIAQFYLLGDPSVTAIAKPPSNVGGETLSNRRLNLSNKGLNLAATLAPSERVAGNAKKRKSPLNSDLKNVFKLTGFTGDEMEQCYEIKTKNKKNTRTAKGMPSVENITFRALIQKPKKALKHLNIFEVLVLKESGTKLLGWRVYSKK